MAIKERKQITGTTAQIKSFAGHEGVLAFDKTTKHLHVLSGTAGETTELANKSDIPDISGKADKTYVDQQLATKEAKGTAYSKAESDGKYSTKTEVTQGLAGKADTSHTHTVSQITDMPKVVLSVNNITPNDSGNVPLGLHAIATSGNYNDLTNKPHIPANTSNWSVSEGINGWARDNSTGFTIVWGLVGPDSGASFARTFDSVFAVTLGPWDTKGYSWGSSLRNTGFKHYCTGENCRYIAVGFS